MDITAAREQWEKQRHKPHTMATWGYDWGIPLMDRVEELEAELELAKLPDAPPDAHLRYLCERCGGTGVQEAGVYRNSGKPEEYPEMRCMSCDGTGYLGLKAKHVAANPPADERRIWWPDTDDFGRYVWPDKAMCFPAITSEHEGEWYASATGIRNYLPTQMAAAKWLYEQQCGPYHPQPNYTKGGE